MPRRNQENLRPTFRSLRSGGYRTGRPAYDHNVNIVRHRYISCCLKNNRPVDRAKSKQQTRNKPNRSFHFAIPSKVRNPYSTTRQVA
jgi:hypothetical protein